MKKGEESNIHTLRSLTENSPTRRRFDNIATQNETSFSLSTNFNYIPANDLTSPSTITTSSTTTTTSPSSRIRSPDEIIALSNSEKVSFNNNVENFKKHIEGLQDQNDEKKENKKEEEVKAEEELKDDEEELKDDEEELKDDEEEKKEDQDDEMKADENLEDTVINHPQTMVSYNPKPLNDLITQQTNFTGNTVNTTLNKTIKNLQNNTNNINTNSERELLLTQIAEAGKQIRALRAQTPLESLMSSIAKFITHLNDLAKFITNCFKGLGMVTLTSLNFMIENWQGMFLGIILLICGIMFLRGGGIQWIGSGFRWIGIQAWRSGEWITRPRGPFNLSQPNNTQPPASVPLEIENTQQVMVNESDVTLKMLIIKWLKEILDKLQSNKNK